MGGLAGMQDSSVASVLPHLHTLGYILAGLCTGILGTLIACCTLGRLDGLWLELSSAQWEKSCVPP